MPAKIRYFEIYCLALFVGIPGKTHVAKLSNDHGVERGQRIFSQARDEGFCLLMLPGLRGLVLGGRESGTEKSSIFLNYLKIFSGAEAGIEPARLAAGDFEIVLEE